MADLDEIRRKRNEGRYDTIFYDLGVQYGEGTEEILDDIDTLLSEINRLQKEVQMVEIEMRDKRD